MSYDLLFGFMSGKEFIPRFTCGTTGQREFTSDLLAVSEIGNKKPSN